MTTAGRYEVVIYYTCPKEDIGSRVEMIFKDAHLEGKVMEAHDPPLVGAEHDRVPRDGESFIKDFKPLHLGVMPLEKGRGLLTLRALQVSGRQVMDVRAVILGLQK